MQFLRQDYPGTAHSVPSTVLGTCTVIGGTQDVVRGGFGLRAVPVPGTGTIADIAVLIAVVIERAPRRSFCLPENPS